MNNKSKKIKLEALSNLYCIRLITSSFLELVIKLETVYNSELNIFNKICKRFLLEDYVFLLDSTEVFISAKEKSKYLFNARVGNKLYEGSFLEFNPLLMEYSSDIHFHFKVVV